MKLLILLVILYVLQYETDLKTGFVAADNGVEAQLRNLRIYSGEKVRDIKDFLFTAVLLDSANYAVSFLCACAKVARFAVVTTAKCISNAVRRALDDGTLIVRGSTLYWQNYGNDDHTAVHIYTHPSFSKKNLDNDVAVVKVREPFERVTWLRLPTGTALYKKNTVVTTLGWGSRQMDGRDGLHKDLYAIDLKMQDWDACSKQFNGKLTKRMFCAGAKFMGPCTYDKGGPVFSPKFENGSRPRFLIGLVSFTLDDLCGVSTYSSVYTNLYQLRSWIMSHVGLKPDNDDNDDNDDPDY